MSGCRPWTPAECIRGRVLRVHGLASVVETDDGRVFRCAVRRLLKSLATDERNVVTTGDVVWVRPAVDRGGRQEAGDRRQKPDGRSRLASDSPLSTLPSDPRLLPPEGMIERVEPRHGVLTRASRRREHVLVANVDQLAIVISLVRAGPEAAPHRPLPRGRAAGRSEAVSCFSTRPTSPTRSNCNRSSAAYAQLGIPVFLTQCADRDAASTGCASSSAAGPRCSRGSRAWASRRC